MASDLGDIDVVRKNGSEQIHCQGKDLDLNLLGFWSWSSSDLVGNALRGMFAEYLVALDLGVAEGVRTEWDSYDLMSESGRSIEVKSAAYIQSWNQKRLSRITFDISPSRTFNPSTNAYSSENRRQADIYVFCVLNHKKKATIDPLDVSQWSFYLLTTRVLNERFGGQKTLSLTKLLSLDPIVVPYGQIRPAVESMFRNYDQQKAS